MSLAACSGSPAAIDAPGIGSDATDAPDDVIDAPPGPCWPMATSMPKGSIEVGPGDSFVPMPETALGYDQQIGFYVFINARIQGLEPGDAFDLFNSMNPRTRFRVYSPTGPSVAGTGTSCGLRYGYKPETAGAFVLSNNGQVTLGTQASDLFDQQFRVLVEIIDATGGYAFDEKVVTFRRPPGWDTTSDAGM